MSPDLHPDRTGTGTAPSVKPPTQENDMAKHATITVKLDKDAIRAGITEAFARLDVEEVFAIVIGLSRTDSDADKLRARALAWTSAHMTGNADTPAHTPAEKRCDRAHLPCNRHAECTWSSPDDTWCNQHAAYRTTTEEGDRG